jgi:hypothetical protein
MCCADEERLDLPPAVIEMVARYRALRAEQGFGWGEDALPELFRWARFSRLGPAFAEFAATGDWTGGVRAAVGGQPPPGMVLVEVDADGAVEVRTGPPRPCIAGVPTAVEVVALAESETTVSVAGRAQPTPGCWVLDVESDLAVVVGDHELAVPAPVAMVPTGTLALTSPDGARWSVRDATGGAWSVPGVAVKWDAGDTPFFHTGPGTAEIAVPAGELRVSAVRGMEFAPQEWTVTIEPGATTALSYAARRRFDPAASGWFGADLHVHLNYSGDEVLHPADAARMQQGEGLHLMHLTAGNLGGDLVYDLELLESTAGRDLWTEDGMLGRAGLEFRNMLLGHVHGLGLTAAPQLRATGDPGTAHPWDFPPNAAACREMRELGAVTSYAHPVYAPDPGAETDPARLFRPFRMVEARELVADAALGLVDGMELASCFDDHGALLLYHHLLSCGLRLAATAGSDAFLSFARGPAPASNPPGWCRVYAQSDELSVGGFVEAVQAGRTLVTNGPWLELRVDGHGPGAVLDRRSGDSVRVTASATGPLVLYGPDGVVASGDGALDHELVVEDGTWLAAAVHGDVDPSHGAPLFAHTSPVHVDVDGRRVVRPASARWCLRLLDDLEVAVREHGRFDPADHDRQLGALETVVDGARRFYAGLVT